MNPFAICMRTIPYIVNTSPTALFLLAFALVVGMTVGRFIALALASILAVLGAVRWLVDPPTLQEALVAILGNSGQDQLYGQDSLAADIRKYSRYLALGLALLGTVCVLLAYGYWIQAHMRAVYRAKLDLEQPRKAAAADKWHRLCDPATVPRCEDMHNGTIQSRVCLLENDAQAWVSVPGQREAIVEDCQLLRLNMTMDVEHVALGSAFNEVCAHAPLLSWICDGCVFVDSATAPQTAIWRLGHWVTAAWSSSGFLMFGIGLSLLASFAPLWAAFMRYTTKNSLSAIIKTVSWGSVADEHPGGQAPLSDTRVDGEGYQPLKLD